MDELKEPTTMLHPNSATHSPYVGVFYIALCLGSISYLLSTEGVLVWLALGVAAIFLLLSLRFLLGLAFPNNRVGWANTMLMVGSIFFCLAAVEFGFVRFGGFASEVDPLMLDARAPLLLADALSPSAKSRMLSQKGVVVLPQEWQLKKIEGEDRSYHWQGVVHQLNDVGFRRSAPFPDKDQETFRIVVFGDSLTYGVGIAAEHTYSAVLQRLLSVQHSVEVLNLGISGHQSADILDKMQKFVPALAPDLIVYGVCLNDFLPANTGQYKVDEYAFPLPVAVKKFFINRSRLGSYIAGRYDKILLQYGIRIDFMDDILGDFDGYQHRFKQDVAAMSEIVQEQHGVPLVGMVLHQTPVLQDRAHQATLAAEEHLQQANFDVVPTQEYFEAYHGHSFQVNRWEGHPNEFSNAVFASVLAAHIEQRYKLEPIQRRQSVVSNP